MTRKGYLTVEEKQTILSLSKKGFASLEVGELINCSHVTVTKSIKRIEERRSLLPLPRTGRPRISTQADDRRLFRIYKSEEKKTARELKEEWHIDGRSHTIRNRLKEQGEKSY